MDTITAQSSDSLTREKPGGTFLPDKKNEWELTPQMEEDIDKRLAIAQEQIRNGQYKPLDDEFMKEFSDKAYTRSKKLLDSKR
uniref:Uncharacterized protein n=1 Tax=Candidatus Kentrum sp. FW TaxID=2126338 RepID=A0A450THC3_9GAMM|nr:MAG: hypothetical protein BECKFW1821C_GA0114237_101031 [Candidatus Kentron sp. FW]